MVMQYLWIGFCVLLVLYYTFLAFHYGGTRFCGSVYLTQLWLVLEASREFGELLDSDWLQFKAEMGKFLLYMQMHFEILKLSR